MGTADNFVAVRAAVALRRGIGTFEPIKIDARSGRPTEPLRLLLGPERRAPADV